MNYWLLGLLILSNAALAFFVVRSASLAAQLRDVRARFQEHKRAVRTVRTTKRHPEMVRLLKASPLCALTTHALRRRAKKATLPNLLPAADADLAALRAVITDAAPFDANAPRSDMDNHARRLRAEFVGTAEICYVNALCIAYLRRNSQHTRHARELFQRLWREEGARLAEALGPRWLLSTLTTFLDHGENDAQRIIGAAGVAFGNTVKVYEWERVAEGRRPDAPLVETALPDDLTALPGIGRISFERGDIFRNTLAMLTEVSVWDPAAGRALLAFLNLLPAGETIFTRADRTKLAADLALGDAEKPPRYWSFGQHPAPPEGPAAD